MTPEERERFEERMKEREAQGGGGFGGGQPAADPAAGPGGHGRRRAAAQRQRGRTPQPAATRRDPRRGIDRQRRRRARRITSGATTIDALFAPLPPVETPRPRLALRQQAAEAGRLRLGVSDGTFTEVLDGEVKEGQEVVVNMVTGLEPTTRPGQTAPATR